MGANYIYQTIHTIAHHPLYVAEHCRLLEQAFMEVYFRPLRLDDKRITEEIITLLRTQRVPTEVSVFVELRVDIDCHEEILVSEISIYDGYSVRCISPSAVCVTFDSPFGHYPTSARREVLRFAEDMAINFGGEVAIECDNMGRVISAGGGMIFGVVGRRIVATDMMYSVERELIIEAAKDCGLEVFEQSYTKKELTKFDELFIGNHYGITSISRCADRYYLPILAEKIVERLAQPWG